MYLHFLKTMWSDIILLQGQNEAALIDTGMADQFPMIRQYLERLGIRELSFILLTHFHRDHYGCIPALLDTCRVGAVYLKSYSGLDCMTAWGTPADDIYRQQEADTFQAMKAKIRLKSRLVPCEGLERMAFEGHEMRLFASDNSIRTIYEDQTHPETYHRFAFSENQNSLAVLMNVHGAKLFFGGDLHDIPSSHPLADCVGRRIAREIGQEVDLYKAPHHGTNHTGLLETLQIYRPRNVVITNGLKYLPPESELFRNLKASRPEARVYLTEHQDVVFSAGRDGTVRLVSGPQPYDLSQV